MADFSVEGGGDFYLLNPHTEKAFIWISENTELPFWDIPYCGIAVQRETFIAIWEDIVKSDLNFTGAIQ